MGNGVAFHSNETEISTPKMVLCPIRLSFVHCVWNNIFESKFIDVLGHALSVGKDMAFGSESLTPKRRVLYAIIVLKKR